MSAIKRIIFGAFSIGTYALGANSYLVKPPTQEQLEELAKAFKWYWLEYNQFAND